MGQQAETRARERKRGWREEGWSRGNEQRGCDVVLWCCEAAARIVLREPTGSGVRFAGKRQSGASAAGRKGDAQVKQK